MAADGTCQLWSDVGPADGTCQLWSDVGPADGTCQPRRDTWAPPMARVNALRLAAPSVAMCFFVLLLAWVHRLGLLGCNPGSDRILIDRCARTHTWSGGDARPDTAARPPVVERACGGSHMGARIWGLAAPWGRSSLRASAPLPAMVDHCVIARLRPATGVPWAVGPWCLLAFPLVGLCVCGCGLGAQAGLTAAPRQLLHTHLAAVCTRPWLCVTCGCLACVVCAAVSVCFGECFVARRCGGHMPRAQLAGSRFMQL